MDSNARNMYVFRDGRQSVSGSEFTAALAAEIRALPLEGGTLPPNSQTQQLLISALMRAGELECALTDALSPQSACLARLTDHLASLLAGGPPLESATAEPVRLTERLSTAQLLDCLPASPPEVLHISPPEGFAYYALHPLGFADLTQDIPLTGGYAAVVGIRSIGTTLSALVTAVLRRRGLRASRITVRPSGHPYARQTEFAREQLRWVAEQRAHLANFLVVDEGPGMSGSSLLSVGEALLGTGVAREHIKILCSREPDVNQLCANNARERWTSFRSYHAAANSRLPAGAQVYIGGGHWRQHLLGDSAQWPASWIHMERLKFLSSDCRELYKFEGLGRYGAEVHARAQLLADGGYSPRPIEFRDGFGAYPIVPGRPCRASDVSAVVLERLAQYCAFRSRAFRSLNGQQPDKMESMLRFNVAEEFGVQLGDLGPFHTTAPVIVDGRMLPHEWVHAGAGELLKLDGATHGDDHFFPGPTDIAWDLAGAVVEWNLGRDAADYFLERYRRASGDDARRRLPAFLFAYTVFRFAYCKMGADAVSGSGEEGRLLGAYEHYRNLAHAQLPLALAA